MVGCGTALDGGGIEDKGRKQANSPAVKTMAEWYEMRKKWWSRGSGTRALNSTQSVTAIREGVSNMKHASLFL